MFVIIMDSQVDEDTVTKLIQRVDHDHDGRVDFNEFCSVSTLVPDATLAATIEYWQQAALLTISDDLVPQPPLVVKAHSQYAINFIAGASSSVLSKTSTAPLERCKVLFQMQTSQNMSMYSTLASIYSKEGFTGLFRGNLMNLIKSSPESAVKLMAFEATKNFFLDNSTEETISGGKLFVAGAVGGVSAHLSCFPLEVLKTKFAGSTAAEYSGITDVIMKTYRQGGVRAFYRGCGVVCLSTIPHSGTSLMTYQIVKDYFASRSETGHASTAGKSIHIPLLSSQLSLTTASGLMAAASVSTVLGQVIACPFHVLKVRFSLIFFKSESLTDSFNHGTVPFTWSWVTWTVC